MDSNKYDWQKMSRGLDHKFLKPKYKIRIMLSAHRIF